MFSRNKEGIENGKKNVIQANEDNHSKSSGKELSEVIAKDNMKADIPPVFTSKYLKNLILTKLEYSCFAISFLKVCNNVFGYTHVSY